MITDPDQVAHEFQIFYTDLYTSKTDRPLEELRHLLHSIDFPTLTASQVDLLEAPITEECIGEAIANLPASKTPGSDGLPLEFYSHFQEVLIPRLESLYSHL